MLIADLDVRIIHAATGEILRRLTLDPTRRYHGTGQPPGQPPENRDDPNPDAGSRCPGCLETSHGAPGRIRTCDARFRNRPRGVRRRSRLFGKVRLSRRFASSASPSFGVIRPGSSRMVTTGLPRRPLRAGHWSATSIVGRVQGWGDDGPAVRTQAVSSGAVDEVRSTRRTRTAARRDIRMRYSGARRPTTWAQRVIRQALATTRPNHTTLATFRRVVTPCVRNGGPADAALGWSAARWRPS